MSEQATSKQINANFFFPSSVCIVEQPDYLEPLSKLAKHYLKKHKEQYELNDLYPVHQTENFAGDPEVGSFGREIAEISWKILYDQGYDMERMSTVVSELWVQEHFKGSGHTEHVHSFGSQITGFYILEASDDSSKIVIHDPRPAKKQINLPERDIKNVSVGSSAINFNPVAGQLILINSYIPHEISRNPSNKPFRIIHFNVNVFAKQNENIDMKSKVLPIPSEVV